MSLLQQVQKLTKQIVSDPTLFNTECTLTATNGDTATLPALIVKHGFQVDAYGAPVNTKTQRITVSEPALIALNYPTRDSQNEVNMIGHTVVWVDTITGDTWNGVVCKNIPGETHGLIVLHIEDYIPE